MKRRYQDPLDPELVERVLRRISEMTPEDWDRELAWRPPPEVYDPWPPYENGTGQRSATGEEAAAGAADRCTDSAGPAKPGSGTS